MNPTTLLKKFQHRSDLLVPLRIKLHPSPTPYVEVRERLAQLFGDIQHGLDFFGPELGYIDFDGEHVLRYELELEQHYASTDVISIHFELA